MGRTSDAREHLVREAMDLFHSFGYNAVGVKQICEAARVNKGSFYHFFPGKRDLALAAIEAQWEAFQSELLEPAFATDLSPLERIGRLFTLTCAYQDSGRDENGQIRGCPFGNLAIELSGQEEEIRLVLEKVYDRMADFLERALKEYSPDADVRARAEELVAYHQGVILLAKTKNDPMVIATMAATAVELARSTAGARSI